MAEDIQIRIIARNEASETIRQIAKDSEYLARMVQGMGSKSEAASAQLKAGLAGSSAAASRLGQVVVTNSKQVQAALSATGASSLRVGNNFQQMNSAAGAAVAGVSSQLAKMQGAMKAAGLEADKLNSLQNLGTGLAVGGGAGILLSRSMAKAGQDVEESENLVKESFGSSLQAAQEWSAGLQKSLAISATEARRNAATFNVMFDSMKIGKDEAFKMSTSLTKLAYDMASFYNLSPEAAFDKLRAGITGEAEPLKALGVLINEETVKNYAYANSIAAAGSALTEQQKVQARYGVIMESTKKAQGDLSRTMDSAANVARRNSAALLQAQQAMGKGASEAQKNIDNITASVLTMVSTNPEVAQSAGAMLTYGSYAATAAGSVLTLGAQAAQTVIGLRLLKATQDAGTIATTLSTAATNTNTAATTASGNAALVAAGKYRALAAARVLGVAGAGVLLGGAIYEATRGEDDPGVMEAAGNAWATTKRAFGIDAEITEEDGLTRSQKLENERQRLLAQAEERRNKKMMESINAQISQVSLPTMPEMPKGFASPLRVSPEIEEETETSRPSRKRSSALSSALTLSRAMVPGSDSQGEQQELQDKLARLPKGGAFDQRRNFYESRLRTLKRDQERQQRMQDLHAVAAGGVTALGGIAGRFKAPNPMDAMQAESMAAIQQMNSYSPYSRTQQDGGGNGPARYQVPLKVQGSPRHKFNGDIEIDVTGTLTIPRDRETDLTNFRR